MPESGPLPELPIVREIGEQLLTAAEGREPVVRSRRPRREAGGAVRGGWLIAAGLPALLALTAAALAAGGVIMIGSPARSPGKPPRNPDGGLGVLRAGTARLLALRSSDPAGGPPWGMRVVATTRGVGCLQVGRIVDGRLGVLGMDGAFADDGRFHEEETALGFVGPSSCATLDSHQRMFISTTSIDTPASAWDFGPGTDSEHPGGCDSPVNTHGASADLLCPEFDERNLYFGLLGARAQSVTYVLGGVHHTVKTVGVEGAYLIVTDAAGDDTHGDFSTDGVGALLSSPITEIRYAGGRVCRIIDANTNRARSSGCQPVGFQPVPRPVLRPGQLEAPVHARVIATGHGHRQIVITFRAGAAVTDASSAYTVTVIPPPGRGRFAHETTIGSTQRNIAMGEQVSWRIPVTRDGVYRGSVVYVQSRGPALGAPFIAPEHGTNDPVGTFRIRLKKTGS
jgi:hypothetical protein